MRTYDKPYKIIPDQKCLGYFFGKPSSFQSFCRLRVSTDRRGIGSGSEITNASGETITSNLKLTASDMQLFESLKGLAGK